MLTKPSNSPFYYAAVLTSTDGATVTYNHDLYKSQVYLFEDWKDCLKVNTIFLSCDNITLSSLHLVRIFDPYIKQLANNTHVVSCELLLSCYQEKAMQLTEEMETFLDSCLQSENEKVSEPLYLRSFKQGNVYLDKNDDVLNTISKDGLIVECSETRHLIKELDRRLCQLWDKVVFERENNLVDYKSIDIRFNHDDAVIPNPLPLNG